MYRYKKEDIVTILWTSDKVIIKEVRFSNDVAEFDVDEDTDDAVSIEFVFTGSLSGAGNTLKSLIESMPFLSVVGHMRLFKMSETQFFIIRKEVIKNEIG